jgi:hypothetical protein
MEHQGSFARGFPLPPFGQGMPPPLSFKAAPPTSNHELERYSGNTSFKRLEDILPVALDPSNIRLVNPTVFECGSGYQSIKQKAEESVVEKSRPETSAMIEITEIMIGYNEKKLNRLQEMFEIM